MAFGGILGTPQPQPGGLMGQLQTYMQNNPAAWTTLAGAFMAGKPGFAQIGQTMPVAMRADQMRLEDQRRRNAANMALKALSDAAKTNTAPVLPEGIDGADVPEGLLGRFFPEGSKPFEGTGLDAQDSNILLNGDPNSPEYAMAYYRQYRTPKLVQSTDEQGRITLAPVMPEVPRGIRPPANMAVDPPSGAGATPAGPTPAPGNGSIVIGQKPPTEEQIKGGVLFESVSGDKAILDKSFAALDNTVGQAGSTMGGVVGRWIQSSDYQVAYDAARNVVQSYIYAVSGAQAPDTEVERNMQLVLPAIGDSKEALAEKKKRLDRMVEAIRIKARQPGAGEGSNNDPLGIR